MAYVLGIDGGGTKTVALVADWNGRIRGQGTAGPSNYHTVGVENALQAIREATQLAIREARLKAPRLDVASLGLAGTGRPGDAMFMQVSLESAHIASKIMLAHDAAIALAGATACQPGVIVIAGTGAIAYGVNATGESKRVDGWGHLIGDAGSAYYVALRALSAAFRAYDGRGPKTLLGPMLIAHFETRSMEDIVGIIYTHREKKQHIASAAPLVVKAANQGDAVSLAILHRAAQELALSATTVIRELGMTASPVQVACGGGMFAKPHPSFREAFRKTVRALAPKAKIIAPRFPSAVGALLLAFKERGRLTRKVLRAMDGSAKRLRLERHQ